MDQRQVSSRRLVASAMILALGCSAAAAAGQPRAQMHVGCVVLPHISIQVEGQQPVYGSDAATITSGPGQVQLTSNTNDPDSSEFILTANSDSPAVVNGREIASGSSVDVGHYRFGVPVELNIRGTTPIRLTASR
jgi:hypothetical protein